MTTAKTVQARMTSKGLRIWLEGNDLIDAGFNHGTTYTIDIGTKDVVLYVDSTGKRKVAGTQTRPVIDMQSKALSKVFNEGMVNVDLSYAEGIIITQGE